MIFVELAYNVIKIRYENKKKIGVSILNFKINEYKTWHSVETAGISKTARVIVLQIYYQTQRVPESHHMWF